MLKVRVTFADNEELESFIKSIENTYTILNKSPVYTGRNDSKYSNVYLDIEKK